MFLSPLGGIIEILTVLETTLTWSCFKLGGFNFEDSNIFEISMVSLLGPFLSHSFGVLGVFWQEILIFFWGGGVGRAGTHIRGSIEVPVGRLATEFPEIKNKS